MRPLRIALLGSSNFPIAEPCAGGMEAHIWQLAHTLTERGHIVTLFAAEGRRWMVDHYSERYEHMIRKTSARRGAA